MTSKNDIDNTKPACCPEGSIGAAPVHLQEDAAPQGHMIEIPLPSDEKDSDKTSSPLVGLQPMPCYCTGAPLETASKIVVVFSDVYGIDAGRHKIFCDHLAERMTTEKQAVAVILPDLHRGVPILQPWIDPTTTITDSDTSKSTSSISFVKDMVGSFLGSPGMVYRLKRDYPPQKIEQEVFQMILPFLKQKQPSSTKKLLSLSCVGFCFGGWVVGRILGCPSNTTMANDNTQGRGVFQCGVGIHPSFQPNLVHGELTTTMAERIGQPMLLLPAWNDVDMKPGTKVVDVMTQTRKTMKDNNREKEDDEIVVSIEFPSMMHGWVSRGDTRDPAVAAEQERALQLTVDFLQQHS